MAVYVASNGQYYTASEVVERFESGRWTPCMWAEETGRQLVETPPQELLLLVPTENVDFSDAFRSEPVT
ncbi:hypothetical protein [Haloarchaeobius sp. HRN-SO-5]|uniref:hypothetical protein n=1 Tax=Haloarchaeobius sp. HRN-SO-5 TaxID=3446118 RepID=UPI003EB86F88